MIRLILSVMTRYFFAMLLILWFTLSITRSQRNEDLRYHRNLLLERIHAELTAQERRLTDRLRSLK